jgi:beta-lactamase superfamily II metal-dependent hydrolase
LIRSIAVFVMNPFFGRDISEMPVPRRVYARMIDAEVDAQAQFVLFDAVEADWFDHELARAEGHLTPDRWRDLSQRAPVYAIEVNARRRPIPPDLKSRLDRGRPMPRWVELMLRPNPDGAAEVYTNVAGPSQRADLHLRPLAARLRQAVKAATDLGPYVQSDADIKRALPTADVNQVFVLDVGQGAANALVDRYGDVIAYVDLGGGVLADAGTWPAAMLGLCQIGAPTVILTHWHYDHFEAANIFPRAQNLWWIAPLQVLGPGPQSAMASALAANGRLLVWGGTGTVARGGIELERCYGLAGNQNRTGLAVWIDGPGAEDPILLPGDAGYKDIGSLKAGRAVHSFAVAHHGGIAPGTPPTNSGNAHSRAAMSYGHSNSYGHPLGGAQTKLAAAGWTLGAFPVGTRIDERQTEDRPGGPGTTGLGHIRLRWSGSDMSRPTRLCGCGCTIEPTQ